MHKHFKKFHPGLEVQLLKRNTQPVMPWRPSWRLNLVSPAPIEKRIPAHIDTESDEEERSHINSQEIVGTDVADQGTSNQ